MMRNIGAYLKHSRGVLLTAVIFAVIAAIAICALTSAGSSITQEQADLLRDSIYSAAISCYAVTGRYPTLEEIQSDYGVVIDTEHYYVYYSSFASNIIPDIEVRPLEEAEG